MNKNENMVPFDAEVNEVIDTTIGLDKETKENVISILEEKIILMNKELNRLDESDAFFRNAYMWKLDKFKNFVEVLKL